MSTIPEETPEESHLEAAIEALATRRDQLEQELHEAADSTDAEHAFLVFASLQILKISAAGGIIEEYEHGTVPVEVETAAFHLYPHFGNTSETDHKAVQRIIDTIPEIHRASLMQTAGETFRLPVGRDAISLSRLHAHSVRGSAWPDQTREEILGIQGKFDSWFEKKMGLSPTRAIAIIEALGDSFESVMATAQSEALAGPSDPLELDNDPEKAAQFVESVFLALTEGLPRRLPLARHEVQISPEVSEREWTARLDLIGLTPEARATMTLPAEVTQRPLYVIGGDKALIIDQSSTFDALFDAFDQVARGDQKFYSGRYTDHVADWMEEKIAEYFKRVFPSASVYQNLIYPDPDNPGGETELDALILWGPFDLLIEAKGRQYRLKGRLERPSHLRTDLERNVHDSFEQATRALRYIENDPNPSFREKATGRIARPRKEGNYGRFTISVSLHHLGPVATQLAVLQELGLFSDGQFPWTVCLADLDIVSRFAETPDILVHYLKRRIEMQESGRRLISDELDLFGHYLDTRLHPDIYWQRKSEDGNLFDSVHIADGSERFHHWKEFKYGLRTEAPEIRLDVPAEIRSVLDEFQHRDDDECRFMAVAILDFHPEDVDRLAGAFRQQRETSFLPGHFPRLSYRNAHDETVITLVAGRTRNVNATRDRAKMRSLIEKYRHRSGKTLAFSINLLDKKRPFDLAGCYEFPWNPDEKMEKLLAKDELRLLPGARPPERNDPCLCGSGKKFKKCCLPRIR